MKCNGKIQLYPCLRIAMALMAGIAVGKAAWPVMEWTAWAAACGVTLALAFAVRERMGQTTLVFAASFLLGAMATSHHMEETSPSLPEGKKDYRAIVLSQPAEKRNTLSCDLLVTDGLAGKSALVKAYIQKDTLTRDYLSIKPGDGIWLYGQLEHPRDFGRESHFDYPLWARAHGFVATCYIRQDDWAPTAAALETLTPWQRAQVKAIRLRERMLSALREKGLEGQEMAIVAAMALGEKAMISEDTREDYSATGVSHVLSLSGLHLGIIFQMIVLLTGKGRRNALHTFCSLLAIWAYTLLVGMSASVIRSAVMITIYALACLLRRDSMSVNSLSLAAIVMLLHNPLYLYDISFQLSFVAVLSILVYQPLLYRWVSARWLMSHRGWRWVWSLVTVSVAAQIATQPLVVYYFGQWACYSLVANLVAVPLATLILYLGVATLVTYPIGSLCHVSIQLLSLCVETLNKALATIASLPGATLEGIHLSGTQLALLYVALAALTLLYSKTSSIMKSSAMTVESLAQGSYPSGKSNFTAGS